MGYSTLKAALDAVVKTNGRQQITGANLNGVMTTILQGVDILDRANPADTSGMNFVVLKGNKTFSEQVTESNTIYEIRDSFDLNNGSLTLPANIVLKFNGGKIVNGNVEGNNTIIEADYYSNIFHNISFSGTFNVGLVSVCWFMSPTDAGISDAFEKAVLFPYGKVFVPAGKWYVNRTIEMSRFRDVLLFGGNAWNNISAGNNCKRSAFLYVDTDIPILRIDGNNINEFAGTFSIIGGVFDISQAPSSYSSNVIDIRNTISVGAFACHKAVIKTTITGKFQLSAFQENATAINVDLVSGGYITDFETDCSIWMVGNGIVISANNSAGKGWISDYVDRSNCRCAKAINLDIHSSATIAGEYQAITFWETSNNDFSICSLNSPRLLVTGSFWDLKVAGNNKYSQEWAIEFGERCRMFIPSEILNIYWFRNWIKNPEFLYLYSPDYAKYEKYPESAKPVGFSEFNNFFIDNNEISSISAVVGGESGVESRLSLANMDKLLSPHKTTNTLPQVTATGARDTDYVEITLNLTAVKHFITLGTTLTNNRFKKFKVELFNGNTKTYSKEINLITEEYISPIAVSRLFVRAVNSFANEVVFTLTGIVGNTCTIFDLIGLVKYDPVHYLSSAGGDMCNPITYRGQSFLDAGVVNSVSELPAPAVAGAFRIAVDSQGNKQLFVHDGTYWKRLNLRYSNQNEFAASDIANYSHDTWYINTATKRMRCYIAADGKWYDPDGAVSGTLRYGTIANLPSTGANIGMVYLVREAGFYRPMFYTGAKFVDANGHDPSLLSGATADRPSFTTGQNIGFMYFDTTLGKPIWWKGSSWVDATGASV